MYTVIELRCSQCSTFNTHVHCLLNCVVHNVWNIARFSKFNKSCNASHLMSLFDLIACYWDIYPFTTEHPRLAWDDTNMFSCILTPSYSVSSQMKFEIPIFHSITLKYRYIHQWIEKGRRGIGLKHYIWSEKFTKKVIISHSRKGGG